MLAEESRRTFAAKTRRLWKSTVLMMLFLGTLSPLFRPEERFSDYLAAVSGGGLALLAALAVFTRSR